MLADPVRTLAHVPRRSSRQRDEITDLEVTAAYRRTLRSRVYQVNAAQRAHLPGRISTKQLPPPAGCS